MIKLVVSIIGIEPSTTRDALLAKIESQTFDPDHAEVQIGIALDAARKAAKVVSLSALRSWEPEVSISLTAEDEAIRPALHLAAQTLQQLSEAGASLASTHTFSDKYQSGSEFDEGRTSLSGLRWP